MYIEDTQGTTCQQIWICRILGMLCLQPGNDVISQLYFILMVCKHNSVHKTVRWTIGGSHSGIIRDLVLDVTSYRWVTST